MSNCKACGKTGLQPDSIHTCTPVALRLADALQRCDCVDFDGDFLRSAAELRRLHEENEALRIENEAFGRRQEWWNNRMVDMEQRYMALVKIVADGQSLQRPNITLTIEQAKDALLRQALEFLDQHCAVKHPSQIAQRNDLVIALREQLGESND